MLNCICGVSDLMNSLKCLIFSFALSERELKSENFGEELYELHYHIKIH